MYVHAYQAKIWNLSASERLSRFGNDVILGDLVIPRDSNQTLEEFAEVDKYTIVEVTDENKDQFSIDDVVLPLPGFEVQCPRNPIGDFMKELLAQDDLTFASFDHKRKDVRSKGGYRHVIQQVSNLSWKILPYSDENIPLILGDYDRLVKNPDQLSSVTTGVESFLNPDGLNEGELRALCLEFDLPSSSYATMLFRELTKQSSVQPVAVVSNASASEEPVQDIDDGY
jgi:tRNA pseudouridine13 synthase